MLTVVTVFGLLPLSVIAEGETAAACEYCAVELAEDAVHASNCPTNCSCDPKPTQGQPHAEGCVMADAGALQSEESPTESVTEPATEPFAESTEPATEPVTEPTDPVTEPAGPSYEDTTLKSSIDGTSIELAGNVIPDGAEAVVKKADPAMLDALSGLNISDATVNLFDISLEVDGEKWQPGAAVMLLTADAEPVDNTITLSIDGLDVEEGDEVTVYHLFDDPNAIVNASIAGTALTLDISGHEDLFGAELEAASYFEAGDGIIFYEIIQATAEENGVITFGTESFSTYVVARGNTTTGTDPWGDAFIVASGKEYLAARSTTITLYNPSAKWEKGEFTSEGSACNWVVGTNTIGIKSPSGTAKSFKFTIPSDAPIGETFTITGGGKKVTITVTSRANIVKEAIQNDWYDVYITCVTDSRAANVPTDKEPGITSASRIFLDKYAQNASNTIKESFASSSDLKNSVDSTATLGIVDTSGDTIQTHLKNIDWNEQYNNIISKAGSTTLYASNGTIINSSNKGNFRLVPYVVKLQTANGYGSWNIDCCIIPKDSTYRYVLKFAFNDGSGSHTTQTLEWVTNSSYTFSWSGIANPTRTGYKFSGWSDNGNNAAEVGTGTTSYKITGTANSTVTKTLTAIWSAQYRYVLNFNMKGGSGGPSNITQAWKDGSSHTFSWTAEPTKTGYTFTGWSYTDDNTPDIKAGTKQYQVTGTAAQTVTKTLYACWTANKYGYTVKYLDKDTNAAIATQVSGTADYGSTVNGTQKSITGYTFSSVSPTSGSVKIGTTASSNVITYYYTENTASINYHVVGDSGCGTVKQNGTGTTDTKVSETLKVVTGSPVGATAAASSHYTFVGWYDNAACTGNPLSTVASYIPTRASGSHWAAKNYYAKFVEKEATLNYKVANGFGGSVAPGAETLKVLTGVAKGSSATAADGYSFVGWYSNEACTNLVSASAAFVPEKTSGAWVNNTTYWAKFEEYTVPIHYQVVGPNGCGTVDLKDSDAATVPGTNVSENVLAATGDAVGATAATANSNFKFVGWYDNAACTGTPVSTNAYYDPPKPSGIWAEKTYYAKFEYTVGHLTISKTGIDSLDHHAASGGNKQEQQTTVYTVTGTASDGTAVDLEVTVVGNGAVTVHNIPVGTYTVTEKGSWSWRYDEAVADSKSATVTGGQTTTAAFSNNRTNGSWLSGDNFLRNIFTTITG